MKFPDVLEFQSACIKLVLHLITCALQDGWRSSAVSAWQHIT
jgi:hypothetical protein